MLFFQDVQSKNKKGGRSNYQVKVQKQKLVYKPVGNNKSEGQRPSTSRVVLSNQFDVLNEPVANNSKVNKGDDVTKEKQPVVNSDRYEEIIDEGVAVDELLAEIPAFLDKKLDGKSSEGASTPGQAGIHG
ncbi:hypothetical protein Hanom_Chr07g00624111 [Helianthus anomalus]